MTHSVFIKLMSIILLGVFLCPEIGHAQEINLKYLYKQWRVKNIQPDDDILILRSRHAASNDRQSSYGATYTFNKTNDSIVYQGKIKNIPKKNRHCGSWDKPKIIYGKETEVWVLNQGSNQLRYDVYFEAVEGNQPADYSAFYKIVKIKRDYLKLQLEKELYEGSE